MAITDPSQRVRYLESFAEAMKGHVGTDNPFGGWLRDLRKDLDAICDPEVRIEAQRRFEKLVGQAIYLLERNPEAFPKHMTEQIASLTEYLKANDLP